MPFHSGAPVQCWVKFVHLKASKGQAYRLLSAFSHACAFQLCNSLEILFS